MQKFGVEIGVLLPGRQKKWKDTRDKHNWVSHCGAYVDSHHASCDAVYVHVTPTFRSDVLTPFSGLSTIKLNKKFPRLLWNRKSHYRYHEVHSQSVSIARLMPSTPYSIHFNIILPSTLRYAEWSLPFRLSNRNSVRFSHHSNACYMLCSPRPIW
jgi:hypothetical protein